MTPTSKKRLKKLLLFLSLIFIALFGFRLIYGYQQVTAPSPVLFQNELEAVALNSRKNYASIKYQANSGQAPVHVDQKYEKIADIKSFSTQFDSDERRLRKEVANLDGLIQFENNSGNEGYRNLQLIIGVPPENFDTVYTKLVTIGKIQAKQITKKDKTNEYKELNAKKASLEKIRGSLLDLKSKGGRIEEYMQLENRILEIEQQLQELGVSLGNFDDENEFCTVKFSLSESKEISIGTLQRVKEALEWTIETYLMLMAVLTFMSLFAYLLLLSIEKIRTKIS